MIRNRCVCRLVALLDADSPSKPNLLFELAAALGMGKRLVAIVPKDLETECSSPGPASASISDS